MLKVNDIGPELRQYLGKSRLRLRFAKDRQPTPSFGTRGRVKAVHQYAVEASCAQAAGSILTHKGLDLVASFR